MCEQLLSDRLEVVTFREEHLSEVYKFCKDKTFYPFSLDWYAEACSGISDYVGKIVKYEKKIIGVVIAEIVTAKILYELRIGYNKTRSVSSCRESCDTCHVRVLIIDEWFQRRGVGTYLFNILSQLVTYSTIECRAIFVEIPIPNPMAVDFFRHRGFHLFHSFHTQYYRDKKIQNVHIYMKSIVDRSSSDNWPKLK